MESVFNNSNSKMYDKLTYCYKMMNFDMEKQDYFLFGFYLGKQYFKKSNAIESENFYIIFSYFIQEYLMERKTSIFEIDPSQFKDNICNDFTGKKLNNINLNKIILQANPFDNQYNSKDCIKDENKNNFDDDKLNNNFSLFYNENMKNIIDISKENSRDKYSVNDLNYLNDYDQSIEIENNAHENNNEQFYFEDHENVNNNYNNYFSTERKLLFITCNICQSEFFIEDYENFKLDCGHYMHFECFKTYSTTQGRTSIKCFECSEDVSCANLQFFFSQLEGNYYDKYEKLLFNNFVSSRVCEMMWCPTPGCDFAFEMAEKFTRFDCRICNKSWCIDCKVEYHNNITCQQYRMSTDVKLLDEEFNKAAEKLKYKPCPKCKFWIEKTQGCNHMTCRCGNEFCYVCGTGYSNRMKVCRCG